MASPHPPEPVDPGRSEDPVEAVLSAHDRGRDLLLRTSGTTGRAGAVVRPTATWWCSFDAYTELSGVGLGARLWLPGPLSTTLNLFAAVHARVHGAHLVKSAREATHACLTPTALARHGEHLPHGTRVVVAGDALLPALHDRATDAGLRVAHYYGAAELSFVAAGEHADSLRPFPGVEVDIREGTIWVRSPYLARGVAGPDGWASVGDRGRLVDGRVVVSGRPDAITTAGATVVLAEVEAALAAHAAAPFAVLGLPHPDLGQVLAAVVTDPADRDRLRRGARATLPASHRPRRWASVPRLPTTAGGKVDRARLGDAFGGACHVR